jgi:hypothetical protein
MALSLASRRMEKNRTQRSRRIEVLSFFVMMAIGLAYAGRPFRWGYFVSVVYAIVRIYQFWRLQILPVSTAHDRAMREYGVEFERLNLSQKQGLERRARVRSYLPNSLPDEMQAARESEASVRAYGVLKILLSLLAVIYWAGWRLLPEGRVRVGWTDAPMVMIWVLLLVLALPQMIRMWREPDDVGEARVVAMGREA